MLSLSGVQDFAGMRWLLLTVLMIGGVATADTYRWVDENGVIHFSDRPHPGAERIELGEVQTFSSPVQAPAGAPPDAGSAQPPPDDAGAAAASYDTFRIVAPQPEETIRNNAGILDIPIDLSPRIRQGHRINLYLDGEPVAGVPRAATSFTIDGVVRGAHTLRAAVADRSGDIVQETPTVRFYVQQVSIQNPNNPNRPPRPTPLPSPRG